MGKDNFDEYLKTHELKKEIKNKIDWEKQKKEWLDHINDFYEKIEILLADYITQNKVEIVYDDMKLTEQYIGEYNSKRLSLKMLDQEVTFTPVGTLMIGSKGRIDMEGSLGKVRFLLADREQNNIAVRTRLREKNNDEIIWEWRIATYPSKINLFEINEDTFYDALMEVISG